MLSPSTSSDPPGPPQWRRPSLTRVGKWYLKRFGWQIANPFPPLNRSVIVVAPHTSNLDFFVGLATAWALDLKPAFVAKHTLFRWPLGPIMRSLGGIPVNRKKSAGFVDRTSELVASSERIALTIAPEGTRKKVERWKTGFYHIAMLASVPVVPAYIDWARRKVGFGTPFEPSGDAETDIAELRSYYEQFSGYNL